MCVGLQCRFNVLMSETFGDQKDGYIHVYEQACVTVPEIVYSDFLYSGELAASFHFMVKKILCVRKHPVRFFQTVNG